MSRSRNTEKEKVWAEAKIGRTVDGQICLPRIIERRPKRGDIHALPKRVLSIVLRKIPVECLYGLARIELQPRQGSSIFDNPLGVYLSDEKAIILYSLPMKWIIDKMSDGFMEQAEFYRAEVLCKENKWHINWPSEASIGVWFFNTVVTHELGHHFSVQYKKKRGAIGGVKYRELNAEMHSFRLTREILRPILKRRQRKSQEK